MPLSDTLLEQGNPALPDRGIQPILGSPAESGSNPTYPTYPTIGFDGLEGTGASKSSGGPSLDEWLAPSKGKSKRVASPFIGVDELAANQRYRNYQQGVDNEEIAAQGQSSWDKWGNSLYKFVGTTLGTFAQGLMTIPDTVTAISNGFKGSDLYQSGLENGVDKWLKNMEDDFPNYYTKWEQDHPFKSAIPFSGGAANFWGDKVIKNLGFTAGAIGSAIVQDLAIGAISGGIGDIPLVSNQVGRLSLWLNKIFTGADDVGKVLGIGEDLAKSSESLLTATNLARAAASVKVGNAARYALNMYGSARTEGGVEARDGYNTLKKNLTDEFLNETGHAPSGIDAQRIEQAATASANVRMGINLALLTVSNAIQFDNFLRPFTASRKAATDLGENLGKIALKDGSIDTFERVVPTTIKGKLWEKVQGAIPNILSEGVYEEGGQYAAQVGTYNYYKHKYDGDIKGSVDDIINETVGGLAAQFGTQEGLENMFLGAITAGISSGGMNLLNGKKLDTHRQAILSTLNNTNLSGSLANTYATAAFNLGTKRDMEAAVKSNNLFAFKNFKHDLFYEFIQSGNKVGRFELRTDQIKMLKELDQKEFEKMWGMEFNDSNRRTASEYVDALLLKADDIKSTADAMDNTFINPYQKLNNDKAPTQESIEEHSKYQTFEDWKTELGHFASFQHDSDSRIASISANIAKISPALSIDILSRITSKEGLRSLIQEYSNSMTTINDALSSYTDPVQKAAEKKRIDKFEHLAKTTQDYLNTGKLNPAKFTPIFKDLLEFEMNNRDAGLSNKRVFYIVPKDKVSSLLTFGKAISQLNERKQFASNAWDKLTSEEGLDKFFKDAESKQRKATPTTEINPITNQVVIQNPIIPDPNSLVERRKRDPNIINNAPRTLDDLKRDIDEGISEIKSIKEGTPVVKKEDVNTVGKFTGNAYNKNGDPVEISGSTKKEVQDKIRAYYDDEENTIRKQAEVDAKLAKDAAEAQKLLNGDSGGVGTNEPNEKIPYEGNKRLIHQIAATTYTTPENSPERIRELKFLNNFDSFPEDVRQKSKVIAVTADNEESVGLKGLTVYKMGTNPNSNDSDNGFIATVFVLDEGKGDMSFLDENGKTIGKVGQPIDIQKVTYSVLNSTRLKGTDGKTDQYISKSGDLGSQENYQAAWRAKRQEILDNAKAGKFNIFEFNISRGVAIENEIGTEKKKETNPIVGTLIDEKDIQTKGILQIPTTGAIEDSNGESIPFPNGRPVIVKGSTIQFVNNRNFTPEEVDNVYDILNELAKEEKKGFKTDKFRQGTNFLNGLLFWGSPKNQKSAGRNQIWIDSGNLHIGPSLQFKFRPTEILFHRDEIRDALSKAYNNVNNDKLTKKFSQPFEEITAVNQDGTFVTKQWKNYQEYLLSPRKDSPLSTTVASKKETGYNYTGKYIRLQGTNLEVQDSRKKPTVTKDITTTTEVKKIVSTPTINTTAISTPPVTIVDGYNLSGGENKFNTGKRILTYTVDVQEVGGKNVPIVNIKKDDVYKAQIAAQVATGMSEEDAEKFIFEKITAPIYLAMQKADTLASQINDQFTLTPDEEYGEPVINTEDKNENAVATIQTSTIEKTPEQIEAEAKAFIAAQGPITRDNSDYRTILDVLAKVQVENWDAAEGWMKENLPNVPLNRLKTVVNRTGGGQAWGVFKDAAIYVYENAEIGTTYHEAFHAVWKLFSTEKQRKDMLKEFRDRKGTFYDRNLQKNVSYINATLNQVNESLAEEFRDYKLNGKIPVKDAKGISRIVKFFADLIAMIKNFILGRKSQEFFRKMDAGKFKTSPVNVRNIHLPNENYSIIDGWNEQTSHEVVQAVASHFMQTAFENDVSLIEMEDSIDATDLYKKVFTKLKKEFEVNIPYEIALKIVADPSTALVNENQRVQIANVWQDIQNNWNKVTKANSVFLRTFGLVNTNKSDDSDMSENVEEEINNDNKNGRNDFVQDFMTIDSKKNASASIRLLFATLIQTVTPINKTSDVRSANQQISNAALQKPEPAYSSIGQQQLLNSSKAFNHILNTISGVTTLEQMMKGLAELANQRSEYVKLFSRLKGDLVSGKIKYDKLSLNDWKLLTKFFDVFAKQRPKALIQIKDETGRTYTINANFGDATRSLIQQFVAQVRTKAKDEDALIKFNKATKTYDINEAEIKTYPIKTPENKVAFLNALGFKFTIPSYYNLSGVLREKFNKAVSGLVSQMKSSNAVMSLEGRTLDITGPLSSLAEVMVRANGDYSESTFPNAEREMVQASVQNNYPSLFFTDFNNVKDIEELYTKFPQLRDLWSFDSEILKLGGKYWTNEEEGGKRRENAPIEVGYIDGTQDKTGKSQQTSKLSLVSRRLQELNQNLNGKYYGLVPADSKTEWLINLGNFISFDETANKLEMWNKIYNKFLEYLSTEVEMSKYDGTLSGLKNMKGKEGKLRFFKDILNDVDPTDLSSVREAVKNFIMDEVEQSKDFFKSFDAISTNEDETYTFNSLDSEFRTDNRIGANISESELDDIFIMRTVNYMISNIEIHKVLFGDPALINDPTKRIKSFWSGTHTPINDSTEFDNFHNKEMNKVGDYVLQEGDPGYQVYKDYMPTVTLRTVLSSGEHYADNDEADSQSWVRDTAYRQFLQKNGYDWSDKDEQQFQYEMAWTRNHLYSIDQYPEYPVRLKELDRAILDEGNPHSAEFGVKKPKGSGLTTEENFMHVYLDKTSMAPLFLRFITSEGTRFPNLAKQYIKMWKHKGDNGDKSIDYIIMDSGRKVGAKSIHDIYNKDGSFNDSDFEENTKLNIPFRNMGIQQEVPDTKTKVTLMSQLSKHATLDVLENGKPDDYKEREENWHSLSEEDKKKTSPIYTKVARNRELLEDLAEDGFNRILKKLGIKDIDGEFSTDDKTLVRKFLKEELTRRDIDQNTINGLSVNPNTGEFNIPLEASPRYIQIKNILYSIVDKEIGSPKVSGGSYVMQSSTMWEEGNRELSEDGKFRVSNMLNYYTKDKPWMEVWIPHWFSKQLRDSGFEGTDQELMNQINKSLENDDVLTTVGARIPTQKLSSADRIKIGRFMPQEMGSTVIVPAELVKKTGGDFDVDKLFTYLKNVLINKEGRISTIKHQGDKQSTLDFYSKEFEDALANKKINTQRYLTAMRFAIEESQTNDELAEYEARWDEAKDRMEGYNDPKFMAELKDNYVQGMYRKALENAYFESLEDLLSMESRKDRLMSANSADGLKAINKRLRNLTLSDKELEKQAKKNNHSLLLSPSYMSQIRHFFNVGKSGLGIANIAQTNHAQNQRTIIFVNTDNLNDMSAEDKVFLGDAIVKLPHNKVTIKGKTYATLSGRTDQSGKFISDEVSQYVDGFVDIAKDTFIIELGATPQTVSVYLLLTKLGVDQENVVMFMNQPIIKQFVKELEYRGWSNINNGSIYKVIKERFFGIEGENYSDKLNPKNFEANIKKYYKDKEVFTTEENEEQLAVLDELMKYAVMANHLFSNIRGSNYDTANFNDSNTIDNKNTQTEQARVENIWSGLSGGNIVPAVDALLDNSFVGKRKDATDQARNAIAKAVPIKIDIPPVRNILTRIKSIFSQKGLFKSEKTQLYIARKLEASFIDYLVQTKLAFNSSVYPMLVKTESAVAYELEKIQNQVKGSQLADNHILKELYSAPSVREFGPKNVKLKTKDNDSYTSDLYTGSLRELRENDLTSELYEHLMRLAIIQSGVRKSSWSFTHLIPVEDYSRIFAPIMQKLDTYTDLDNFEKNYAFFRNNWNDEDIVPTLFPKWFEQTNQFGYPDGYYDPYTQEYYSENVSPLYYNVPASITGITGKKGRVLDFIAVNHKYNKTQNKYPVIKVEKTKVNPATGFEYTNRDIAIMRKKGDYSYRERSLYAVVMNGETPLVHDVKNQSGKVTNTFTIYKQINAWGDGDNAQEYYGQPQLWIKPDGTKFYTSQSAFDNGFMRVEREFSDEEILDAYSGTEKRFPDSSTPRIISGNPAVNSQIKTDTIEEAKSVETNTALDNIKAVEASDSPKTIEDVNRMIAEGDITTENCE